MKPVDKLLLGLLIVLLPLGLWAAHRATQPNIEEEIQSNSTRPATVEELTQIIQELQQPVPTSEPNNPEIQITNVSFASESGTLQVAGTASDPQLSVMVSATVLPLGQDDPQELTGDPNTQDVLGYNVEIRSLRPLPGGGFQFHYRIPPNTGAIEIRFDQAQSSKTVIYDVTHDTHSTR